MALNIKSDEAYILAAELARLTGTSMTAAVTEALRIRLQQIKQAQSKEARLEELMAIGRRCAAHIQKPVSAVQHGDLLYGDTGMPG